MKRLLTAMVAAAMGMSSVAAIAQTPPATPPAQPTPADGANDTVRNQGFTEEAAAAGAAAALGLGLILSNDDESGTTTTTTTAGK